MKMKRVFLKLNGGALADPRKTGSDEGTVKGVTRQVKLSIDAGIQVGVVTGEGNLRRGRAGGAIDRTKADQIGMLATVINCIYVPEIFRNVGMMTQILTPFAYSSMTKLFSRDRANKYSKKGMVIFFAGGTDHPYFSIDMGIALRAIEMEADCILLARAIDGAYNSDPKLSPEAKKYGTIPIQEVIDRQLAVVDLTTSVMCMEHKIPMTVLSLNEKNEIADAIQDQVDGTIVTA